MIHLIVSSLCLIIILLILYIIYLKKYVYISFLDKLDSFSDPNDLNHIINSIKNNTDEFNKIKQDKNVIIWICNLIDSIPIISNYNLYSLGKKLLKKIPFIGHNKKFIVLHHKYSEKKISIVLFSFLKDLLVTNTEIKITDEYFGSLSKIICNKLDKIQEISNSTEEEEEMNNIIINISTRIGIIITGNTINNNYSNDFQQIENISEFQKYFSDMGLSAIKYLNKNKDKIILNKEYGNETLVLITNCISVCHVINSICDKISIEEIQSLLDVISNKIIVYQKESFFENLTKLVFNLTLFDIKNLSLDCEIIKIFINTLKYGKINQGIIDTLCNICRNRYQKTKQIVDSGLHTFILDFIDNIFYNKINNDYGDIIISFLEILFLFSKRGRIKKYFSLDNLENLRKYLDYYNDNNDIFSIEICNIIENILNNIKNNVNNYLTEEESSELPKIKFKITNDDDICPICHNEFIEDEEIVLLKCNHKYHNDCIREWSHHLATCPLCTKEIEI